MTMSSQSDVMIYALTTCRWCSKTKLWFEEQNIPFRHIDVDALQGEAAAEVAEEVERVSGGRRFPVTVIDGVVVVGFQPEKFAELTAGDDGQGQA
jgi:glutaredoxin